MPQDFQIPTIYQKGTRDIFLIQELVIKDSHISIVTEVPRGAKTVFGPPEGGTPVRTGATTGEGLRSNQRAACLTEESSRVVVVTQGSGSWLALIRNTCAATSPRLFRMQM